MRDRFATEIFMFNGILNEDSRNLSVIITSVQQSRNASDIQESAVTQYTSHSKTRVHMKSLEKLTKIQTLLCKNGNTGWDLFDNHLIKKNVRSSFFFLCINIKLSKTKSKKT